MSGSYEADAWGLIIRAMFPMGGETLCEMTVGADTSCIRDEDHRGPCLLVDKVNIQKMQRGAFTPNRYSGEP